MTAELMDRVERWAGPLTGLVGAVVAMIGMTMTDIIALGGNIVSSGNANARILAENKDRLGLGTAVLMIGLFLLVWSWSTSKPGSPRPETPAGWPQWRRRRNSYFVQGGGTTALELEALRRPFLFFPNQPCTMRLRMKLA